MSKNYVKKGINNMKMSKKLVLVPVLAISVSGLAGCGFVKPYDKPEYVEIKPNQTAFVIPLEGKTSDQGKLDSEKFLKKAQVSSKRIQVPHRWVKTGKWRGSGKYVDTVRVIVVDRYPETREWTDGKLGAFVGESKDSIKFKQGMSATAQILEDDTSTFLYQYSGKSLKKVMDKEIRNKIGSVLLEKYGTMNIDDIRESKADVIEYVRKEVEPYFKKRGITLSNIGYIGDLQYLQSDIQESINKKFKAEQEQKAQAITNKTEIEKAKADAEAAKTRQSSIEAQTKLLEMENQKEWIKAWEKGGSQVPEYIGGDGAQNFMFKAPTKK